MLKSLIIPKKYGRFIPVLTMNCYLILGSLKYKLLLFIKMTNILEELSIKFDRYTNILIMNNSHTNLLKMVFDDGEHEHDPNLFDQTYVLCFYYKKHLVMYLCNG